MDELYLFLYSTIYKKSKRGFIKKNEAIKILGRVHHLKPFISRKVLKKLEAEKYFSVINDYLQLKIVLDKENTDESKSYMRNYMKDYRSFEWFKW